MIYIFKDVVTSTQDMLKASYKDVLHGTFLCAGFQTQGHGQFDRAWESEKNQNILCSLLIKPQSLTEDIQKIVSATIIAYLHQMGIDATFKAPNDIMVNSQKICGVLVDQIIEADHVKAVIIGIGLNVNQQQFHGKNATSMAIVHQQRFDLEEIRLDIYELLKRFI